MPSFHRLLLYSVLAVAIAGCGGGSVSIGIGIDGDHDDPPSVALGELPDTVASGSSLDLQASASDDSGEVEQVDFFREFQGRREFLGSDLTRPYVWRTAAPRVDRPTDVVYFARAYDRWGQRRDSASRTVRVLP